MRSVEEIYQGEIAPFIQSAHAKQRHASLPVGRCATLEAQKRYAELYALLVGDFGKKRVEVASIPRPKRPMKGTIKFRVHPH